MKFLIVGAGGNLGAPLHRYLVQSGRAVLGTSRNPVAGELVQFDPSSQPLQEVVPGWFNQTEEPIAVVLASGLTDVEQCEAHPEASRAANLAMPLKLARECQALNASLLVFSTNLVFDGQAGNYDEESPLHPLNVYGQHKAELDRVLLDTCPESLIYRLDKVIDPSAGPQSLFGEWHRAALAGRPIRCIAGLRAGITGVHDVCTSVVTGLEMGLRGLFHVSSPEFLERQELVRLVLQELGLAAEVQNLPLGHFGLKAKRPLDVTLNSSRFRTFTGQEFTPVPKLVQQYQAGLLEREHLRAASQSTGA